MNAANRVLSLAFLASASIFGLSTPAFAQAAAEDDKGLEEIIVTANKRAENIQLAPLAITAISAAQAELRGISEVKDISSLAPNVSVVSGTTNATASVVTIRGISTAADESQGFDSPIGIYIDGVYVARSSASTVEVADIERIEVLRGPQGTLFGRNTTGGAVNFISRDPSKEAGVRIKAGYGNYNLVNVKGTFDTGEFADGLRMSFGGVYKRRDGTVDNLLEPKNSRDPGAFKTTGFRWATVFEPTDTIKVTNIFDYTKIKGTVTANQLAAVGTGAPNPTVFFPGFNNVTPAPVAQYLAQSTITQAGCPKAPSTVRLDSLCQEGAAPYTDKIWGELFRIETEFGGVKLRSSTSFRKWRNIQTGTDLDGLGTIRGAALGPSSTTFNGFPAAVLTPVVGAGAAAFLSSQPVFSANVSLFQTVNDRRNNQYSQEVELISNGNGNLDWVLGAFYFHESGYELNPQQFGFVLDTNQTVYNATNFGPLLAPVLQATNPARYRAALQNTTLGYRASGTSKAIYGQATYRPGGKEGALGITLGLRYTWDHKKIDRFQNGAAAYTNPAEIALNRGDAKFSAPTGNFTIDYRASDDVNLYARVARGYRSGGFNARQATILASSFGLQPFDNETIWSYEAGIKTEFSNRVRLNAAVFYNTYKDLQVTVPVPIVGSGSFGTAVANAGKVNYWGFELEGQFKATDNFWFDGNLGYTHKKYKEFNTLNDATPRAPVNIASIISPGYAPDWTATIAANAKFPLGDSGHVTARVGYNYTSDFILFTNPITAPFQKETNGDSRGLVDAQLRFDGFLGSGLKDVSFTLWGKNLTDKEYRIRSVDFGQLGFATTIYGEPRTFGATLDIGF
jgi:iron complex outermembrane recepter protein